MASGSPSDAVRLTEDQIATAGEVLARAFAADPLLHYLIPDESERDRILPRYYIALVRYGYLYGEVYTTVGRVEGVAVWLPPGEPQDPLERARRLARSGLDQAPDVLGTAAFGRLVAVVGWLERARRGHVPMPHWYLNQLGVEPERRGQGIASALLRPVLDRAAGDGTPCYLETFAPANLPFYRRLGFHVLDPDVEPSSGLPFWACRRPPPP